MTTISRRDGIRKVEEIFRQAQLYLHLRSQKLAAEKEFAASAKPVKSWLFAKDDDGKWLNGEEDTEGNRVFRFSRVIHGADGKLYQGVMLRRSQGASTFDEKEVETFVCGHRNPALRKRVMKQVWVVDLEELYVLQQEGEITEAELRGLMHPPPPTYALWPLEVTPITEEE